MLNDFAEKKETFLAIKNIIFQSLKNRIFPKGLTHGFGQKKPIFFSLDLIKIRLEITLSEFAMKKETFLTLKNRIFQSAKNHIFFSKGSTNAFGQKMPIFYLNLIKISLEIMLSDFAEIKATPF